MPLKRFMTILKDLESNGFDTAYKVHGRDAIDVAESQMIPFRSDPDQRVKMIDARRNEDKKDNIVAGATITGASGGAAALIAELKNRQEKQSNPKSKTPVNKARGGMATKWENKWG